MKSLKSLRTWTSGGLPRPDSIGTRNDRLYLEFVWYLDSVIWILFGFWYLEFV